MYRHNIRKLAEYGNLLNVPLNQWPFNLHPPVQTLFEQLNIISQHLINYTGIFNTFPEIHCNITPLELHPYIDLYPIDINRRLLFIGTFPPFSYIHQNLNNTGLERLMNIYNRPIEYIIPWFLYFYGNDNSLWRYLPGIENVEQLDVNFIQNWNLIYDVSFTDIIRSCQRSRFQSTDDKDLYNIIFNSKVFESLLNPKSNIDKLYFTSGKWQAQILNGNAKLNALKLFLKASMEAGIMVNVASWNQPEQMHFLEVHDELLDGKALFCLKLNERIFKVICLPSPSGSASRRIKSHPFFRGWLHFYNPEIFQLIEDGALIAEVAPGLTDIFRRQIYEIAINQDFETLSIFQDFP